MRSGLAYGSSHLATPRRGDPLTMLPFGVTIGDGDRVSVRPSTPFRSARTTAWWLHVLETVVTATAQRDRWP